MAADGFVKMRELPEMNQARNGLSKICYDLVDDAETYRESQSLIWMLGELNKEKDKIDDYYNKGKLKTLEDAASYYRTQDRLIKFGKTLSRRSDDAREYNKKILEKIEVEQHNAETNYMLENVLKNEEDNRIESLISCGRCKDFLSRRAYDLELNDIAVDYRLKHINMLENSIEMLNLGDLYDLEPSEYFLLAEVGESLSSAGRLFNLVGNNYLEITSRMMAYTRFNPIYEIAAEGNIYSKIGRFNAGSHSFNLNILVKNRFFGDEGDLVKMFPEIKETTKQYVPDIIANKNVVETYNNAIDSINLDSMFRTKKVLNKIRYEEFWDLEKFGVDEDITEYVYIRDKYKGKKN